MTKYAHIYSLLLLFVFSTSGKGQVKTDIRKDGFKSETKNAATSTAPKGITRNIIQDKKGNLWIATFDGIFKYDGKSFTNITGKVSSARFFSVLEDSKGNLWFGSIGSGVYRYDGKFFKNYTTNDGLAGNEVTCIYQDKTGIIWFGTQGGLSRYDGRSFRNYTINDGLPKNGINSIIEDKTGNFWFGTTGNAYAYDGKKFTVFTHNNKPFTNVRSIIEDKKGNIWLGGNDGLWRYDGHTFTNVTHQFVGYVMEDKKGNIWSSSKKDDSQALALTANYGERPAPNKPWAIYRYDAKSLANKKPMVTEIASNAGMICGVLEANDGSIWFGAVDGVHRLDGNMVTYFKRK